MKQEALFRRVGLAEVVLYPRFFPQYQRNGAGSILYIITMRTGLKILGNLKRNGKIESRYQPGLNILT